MFRDWTMPRAVKLANLIHWLCTDHISFNCILTYSCIPNKTCVSQRRSKPSQSISTGQVIVLQCRDDHISSLNIECLLPVFDLFVHVLCSEPYLGTAQPSLVVYCIVCYYVTYIYININLLITIYFKVHIGIIVRYYGKILKEYPR